MATGAPACGWELSSAKIGSGARSGDGTIRSCSSGSAKAADTRLGPMLARSRVRAPVIVGEFDVGMYSEDERGLDPRREFASRDLDMARAYVLSMAFLLAG